MTGKVLTFYSYKGGVGRSMALANVAVLLATRGHRVLIVDWDLEAPGIEQYFRAYLAGRGVHPIGVVDLMQRHAQGAELDWRQCLIPATVTGIELHILGAGHGDPGYAANLAALSWKELFAQHDLGRYLERLRTEWTADYDFVLIDSRTGITDIGGICTIHLPDVVIGLFTSNEQSLTGVVQALRDARREHAALPVDRSRLVIVPVPARDESQSEHERSEQWYARFAVELDEFYRSWLPATVTPAQALDVLRIPYKAYWSFGEPLPVIEEGITKPTSLGYAYALLASLVETGFDWSKMTAGRFSVDRSAVTTIPGAIAQQLSPQYRTMIADAGAASAVTSSPGIAQTAASPYEPPPQASPFGGQSQASPYGPPSQAALPYGGPPQMPYGSPPQASLPYGGPPQTSPYGGPPQVTSPYGPPPQATELFGRSGAQAPYVAQPSGGFQPSGVPGTGFGAPITEPGTRVVFGQGSSTTPAFAQVEQRSPTTLGSATGSAAALASAPKSARVWIPISGLLAVIVVGALVVKLWPSGPPPIRVVPPPGDASFASSEPSDERIRDVHLEAAQRAETTPLQRALLLREIPARVFPTAEAKVLLKGQPIPEAVFRSETNDVYENAQFDRDGERLVLARRSGVVITAITGLGRRIVLSPPSPVKLAVFAADNLHVITAELVGMTIWDAASGAKTGTVPYFTDHLARFDATVNDPDGARTFFLAGRDSAPDVRNTVFAVDAAAGTADRWWTPATQPRALGYHNGLLCAMLDGAVYAMQQSNRPEQKLAPGSPVDAAVFAGDVIALARGNRAVAQALRLDKNKNQDSKVDARAAELTINRPGPGAAYGSIAVGDKYLAAAAGSSVDVVTLTPPRPIDHIRPTTGNVAMIALAGDWLLIGSTENSVDVVRLGGDGARVPLIGPQPAATLLRVAFSPNGGRAMAVWRDGIVRVWAVRAGGVIDDAKDAEVLVKLRTATSACLSIEERASLLKESTTDASDASNACLAAATSAKP